MEKKEWRLVHLHYIVGSNRRLLARVIQQDPELTHLYDWDKQNWKTIFNLPDKKASAIVSQLHLQAIKQKIVQFAEQYHIITIFNIRYPTNLLEIPDPPFVLYLQGNLEILSHSPNLSVIGTRYPSQTARSVMNIILPPLLQENFLFTSGMALGIDGYAHETALANCSRTIAVLGSGFYHIYPTQHQYLYQQLIQENLVMTEYPPDHPPKKYYFPERNRIISGLSFGTLVIEAKEKSGSLITVDQALEQGKEVFAVPGNILADTSAGCHQLIKDGAKLVQKSEDILEEWHAKQLAIQS
ncbi:DNA-processing protein DprA [Gracilibacillus caseinilyticus]|uniref:DNA-processing protein DprA n=1 Tax=Gracilibacillus caseinilyticus TaxID=2932256 RepID=A0ABY4ETZ6_9BACI|nr:DNA-processing protein DprA [Gracilibacillus caseinilyticus]UOQ47889.1 DNA-processing protein DprA [Gracilibacillus caseinilyticus]